MTKLNSLGFNAALDKAAGQIWIRASDALFGSFVEPRVRIDTG